jgi:hypothetical protein
MALIVFLARSAALRLIAKPTWVLLQIVLPNREAYLVLLQISIGLSAVEHPNGLRRIYMSILLKCSSVDNMGSKVRNYFPPCDPKDS